MISGTFLMIVFALAIILMIVAISRWKVHPFLAIMGVSFLLALVLLPIDSITATIGKGFSSIFASIGIVIILGTLIGLILEKTGAAMQLANTIIKLIGKRHPQLAMLLVGWIVSVPVFCDSGFVIVNPIRKWLGRKSQTSSVTLTVALSAGLFASHVFIPPTPGPVAAAGLVGLGNNLLLVILLGVGVSIPALAAAYFYANYIGRKVKSSEDAEDEGAVGEESMHKSFGEDAVRENDLENNIAEETNLPGAWASIAPILVPIVFMALGSVASFSGLEGVAKQVLVFLGQPIVALTAGLLCAIPLLFTTRQIDQLYDITQDSLKTSGPIIFITAAGSVLGCVISEAGFVQFIQQNASSLTSLGLLFPFVIAAILKTAQGSSTVALTTTAGIMGLYFSEASLMTALGFTTPLDAAMVVMAIGAGAMTVSHANDSYFWVVTNFGGLSPQNGYKTQTAVTGIMGIVSMAALLLLSLFV